MEELMQDGAQEESRERRRKRTNRLHFSVPVPRFLLNLGEDVRWYYDIRLWSPLILLVLLLALIPGKGAKQEEEPAATLVPVVEMPAQTQPETVAEPLDPQAEALARLAESVGSGRSDNAKLIIMWVAINRSEDQGNGYGQSLLDEIARPNQWQGYDPTALYSEHTYELAKSVLQIQRDGSLRPLDSDMLWLVLNDNGSVTVRNQFTANGSQRWREKTVS